jgi:hypothetical protein
MDCVLTPLLGSALSSSASSLTRVLLGSVRLSGGLSVLF